MVNHEIMLERKSIKGFVERHYITNGGIDTPSACGGVVHYSAVCDTHIAKSLEIIRHNRIFEEVKKYKAITL